MAFVLNIILRAFGRISERSMGVHDLLEEETIAGVLIVGMVALRKITKHPIYRSRVGVRADFQDFVIVDERRGFHQMLRSCPPRYFGALFYAAHWRIRRTTSSYTMSAF